MTSISPIGGVFSITNRMRDGALVEVATVGRERMLGIGVFLGDRSGSGRTLQLVPDGPGVGPGVAQAVTSFLQETAIDGNFREMMASYAQATLLQTMQCTACNALHDVLATLLPLAVANSRSSGCGRFSAEAEFLAVMLGVRRPTVTDVLRALKEMGLISTRYGHIRVLKRRRLEAASCECYAAIRAQFARLGL